MEAIVATSDSDESPSSESFSRDNEGWGYEGAPPPPSLKLLKLPTSPRPPGSLATFGSCPVYLAINLIPEKNRE